MIRLSTLVLYTCVFRVLGIPYITRSREQNNHEYGRRLSLWVVCSQTDVCACQHDIICYILEALARSMIHLSAQAMSVYKHIYQS